MNDEILSRLLDGDLPPEEEAEVRARIADDPELAARWQRMQSLGVELDALVPELPVPPELDARVLGPKATGGWRRPLLAATGLLVAATVLLGLGLWARPAPPNPVELALVSGSQRVRGEGIELLAGDARVRVDGEAWVRVEPSQGSMRRPGQEDPMNHVLSAAGGAVGGAIITVSVIAGTASVWSPADAPREEPVVVTAGDTHRIGAPVSGLAGGGEPSAETLPVDASDPEALAQEVGRLRFENQLLKGQLELHRGTPLEWPVDLPEGLRAEGFDERARRAGEAVEGLEVVRTDCEEYPCILVARVADGLDPMSLHEQLGDIEDALTGDAEGDYNTFASVFQRDDGESASAYGLLAVAKGQEGEQELDPNLRTRLMERTRALESEMSQSEDE